MRGANIGVKNLSLKEFLQVFCLLSISITNILLKGPFQNSLLRWYKRNKRDLPWRHSEDPYFIWLSEVILQQTRVDQGLPYYQKFVSHYPTVENLAAASEDSVLKDWEGLGYYSRARNLHAAAKQIVEEYKGRFPDTYNELIDLKGVGDYTAAAISSIAYNEAHAVLDGNVYRVLARVFNIEEAINSTVGKKIFKQKAEEVLDRDDPGTFNQALMEFGALQCVPRKPDCDRCILRTDCKALALGKVDTLPVKIKKKHKQVRFLNYAALFANDKVYIEKRTDKGIWQNLYQFWLNESSYPLSSEKIFSEFRQGIDVPAKLVAAHKFKPHQLSHQILHIAVLEIAVKQIPPKLINAGGLWVGAKELKTYAFPRPLRSFLERNQLTLRLD